ncbi:Gfo/Idh/MocA family protein [Phreatobacter sp. AB_2022a]|uniref:Gfo/Idh/MocA family protein n=1 Tax=Phreatobacter sp. AB_2022a TaxID=3003134 RepID=UPI002286FC24|nr:Gfo/Idh/MocA family oxidoreductase [Phreatobacter sp. AB_2022a]MCZ0734289.1 Gfo/Idh/MocA family oxidoreductase [Phreatobacter sp. AB_2022a]
MSVSIGIIGAGIMGERLLRAILDQPAELVTAAGIWDPSAAAMARMEAALPAVPRLADAAAVVAAADCVYVASPPASHLGHARAALAAGKTVFCEKPLAVDVAAARAFVAEAGGRGAVNFPFASSPAVATVRRWIGEGAVGRITGVTIDVAFATWPRSWQVDAAGWLDRPAEGGFTREVVSHFLFLSRRLVGPLNGLKAEAAFPEAGKAERRISAQLRAGDVPVTLAGSVGTTAKDDHNIWMLEGEAGAVRLCDWSVAERRGPDGNWQRDPAALPNDKMRPLTLKHQLEGVARLVRGEPHHLATLSEALDVQETVEAILRS